VVAADEEAPMTTIERPNASGAHVTRLHHARLRAWCVTVLGALLVQVLLGAANVSWLDIPEPGDPPAPESPQWLLQTHAWLGTAIVLGAIVLLVLAIRSHDRSWVIVAVIGLVGLVLALVSGDRFVRSHGREEAASMAMACGAVLALAAYTVGVARRRSS
jgi:heme A synthase